MDARHVISRVLRSGVRVAVVRRCGEFIGMKSRVRSANGRPIVN